MFKFVSFAAATSSRRVFYRSADISLLDSQFSYRYKGYVAGLEPGCEKARQSEKHEHEKIHKAMVQLKESHDVSASESSTATLVTANTPKNAELLKYDENLKVGQCCEDARNDSVQPSALVKDEITQGTSTSVCEAVESQCSDSVPAEPAEKKPTSSGQSVVVVRLKKPSLSVVYMDPAYPGKCYRFRVLKANAKLCTVECVACRGIYFEENRKYSPRPHTRIHAYKFDLDNMELMEDPMKHHFPDCQSLKYDDGIDSVLKKHHVVAGGYPFKMVRNNSDYSFLLPLDDDMTLCHRLYCFPSNTHKLECTRCRKRDWISRRETGIGLNLPQYATQSDGCSVQVIGNLDCCDPLLYSRIMETFERVDEGTAKEFIKHWHNGTKFRNDTGCENDVAGELRRYNAERRKEHQLYMQRNLRDKIQQPMVKSKESNDVSASESCTAVLMTANTPKNAELLKYDENLKVGQCCEDAHNDSVQPSSLVRDEITQGTSTTVCTDGESQCSDSVPAQPAEKKPTSNGNSVVVVRTKKPSVSFVYMDPAHANKCYRFRILIIGKKCAVACVVCRDIHFNKKENNGKPPHNYKFDLDNMELMEDPMEHHLPDCRALTYDDGGIDSVLTEYHVLRDYTGNTSGYPFKMVRKYSDYSALLPLNDDISLCHRFHWCPSYGFKAACTTCRTHEGISRRETGIRSYVTKYAAKRDGNSLQLIDPLSGHLPTCNSIPYSVVMETHERVDEDTAKKFINHWINTRTKFHQRKNMKKRDADKKKAKPST